MRILLTNDDGYESLGINTLRTSLLAAGHEVWVCAPSNQRSATSHSMTLRGDVFVTKYADRSYHCSGSPADCILYGLKGEAVPVSPDVVISGINHGYNLSTDILYSGTVGAASEAALMGIPAIAISAMCDQDKVYPFSQAAMFLVEHLERFLPLCDSDTLVNINVPPKPNQRSWRVGNLGHLEYYDSVERCETPSEHVFDTSGTHFGTSTALERSVFRLRGGVAPDLRCDTMHTDFSIVVDGDISVTALQVLPATAVDACLALRAMSECEK
ncbi:MAG: 5'/3'-nucleotidase SurE [Sphaerochaetaceae bacterium]|nr:5'/3'-nucleotidase SurE [Sphaerochaetaceae bacterium]